MHIRNICSIWIANVYSIPAQNIHLDSCICNIKYVQVGAMASLDLSGEETPSRKIVHGRCGTAGTAPKTEKKMRI